MVKDNLKVWLTGLAFALLSIIIIGLFWLATNPLTQKTALSSTYYFWFLVAFLSGISMIFLPCTLPLAFVVVPMSMGKDYKKGLFTAISFGIGLSITLTFYGVFVSFIGKYLGMDQATQFMFIIAGLIALFFGLSELKLLKFEIPGLNIPTPEFIRKRKGYFKSFLMGLFLGNAGVGCPNPFFYWLLIYIGITGNPFVGGSLGLLHGIGRAIPLIFLSVVAILGVNLTKQISSKGKIIRNLTAWALIFVGAFILQIGLFGMYFWETSPIHSLVDLIVQVIAPALSEEAAKEAIVASKIVVSPSMLERYVPGIPWLFIVLLMLIPWIWKKIKIKKEKLK